MNDLWPEVKSSYDWVQELKPEIRILDPDGWDRQNYHDSMSELITRKEFEMRFMKSTVQMPAWKEDGDNSIWRKK